MLKIFHLAILTIILICVSVKCAAERTKDKMYEPIIGATACFRRMNGTHQIGCSSTRSGSTGVVHFIESENDVTFLLENATASPYIPVLSLKFFTTEIVTRLKNSNKISGIVLFNKHESLSSYTHEDTCPNREFNLGDTCKTNWNEYGTDLLNQDYPFPIFYIDSEDEVAKIKNCYDKFNNYSFEHQSMRSLCALELSAFMYATTDTPTCVRRSNSNTNLNPVKLCDPLGDENIWASLFPIAEIDTRKSQTDFKYIVLATRLDTTSLFHEIMPGAANPITGIVTLLATAKLLKQMLPSNNKYEKNVLFIFLNGETYDYIGSQRLLYDMENDAFPIEVDEDDIIPLIKPENISLFIELSQLSFGKKVYAHVLRNTSETDAFLSKLSKHKNIDFKTSVGSLPPSSLQTFLKNRNMSGLVLADHKNAYLNHFYNSIYDNASNINYKYYNTTEEQSIEIPFDSIQWRVANISEAVALSVYEEVTGYNGGNEIGGDVVTIVDELFHCYLENPNCLIHRVFQKKKLRDSPYSFYVGVSVAQNSITSLIGLTLAWLTGDEIRAADENCVNDPNNHIFRFFNMSKSLEHLNDTVCIRSTINFTEAVSPAFIIENYDWKSAQYSSWTESTWHDITMRIFLKPSSAHENITIAIGSMMLIFSFIIVYFVKSRAHILFAVPATDSPTSC